MFKRTLKSSPLKHTIVMGQEPSKPADVETHEQEEQRRPVPVELPGQVPEYSTRSDTLLKRMFKKKGKDVKVHLPRTETPEEPLQVAQPKVQTPEKPCIQPDEFKRVITVYLDTRIDGLIWLLHNLFRPDSDILHLVAVGSDSGVFYTSGHAISSESSHADLLDQAQKAIQDFAASNKTMVAFRKFPVKDVSPEVIAGICQSKGNDLLVLALDSNSDKHVKLMEVIKCPFLILPRQVHGPLSESPHGPSSQSPQGSSSEYLSQTASLRQGPSSVTETASPRQRQSSVTETASKVPKGPPGMEYLPYGLGP